MIEQAVHQAFMKKESEKSFIDKIISRKDVDAAREIMKKEHLTRSDLVDLLHLCSSSEVKLLNYNDWDRYVILKYFVWIREFVSVLEGIYDYKADLIQLEKEGKVKVTKRMLQTFDNSIRLLEHNLKFLVDLYFNIARTTLSLQSHGFKNILLNKFEFSYPTGTDAQQLKGGKP